jgi:hypothetical protein
LSNNKLQTYLSRFCKKLKMENAKRTRVVLLAREKRATTNHYEEQKKSDNGKKLQICAKAARIFSVLLTNNWCSFF